MELRLSPTSASRKLIVLAFIKRYFSQWGYPPSYSEIAAVIDRSPQHVRNILKQLAKDGSIILPGGERTLRLPDPTAELSEGDALTRLSRLGWTINAPSLEIGLALMKTPLPLRPQLDHRPDVEVESEPHD